MAENNDEREKALEEDNKALDEIVGDYKYGFKTSVDNVLTSGKGLSRSVVEFISKV